MEAQEDGRVKHWRYVPELGHHLLVITTADGALFNAFDDTTSRVNKGEKDEVQLLPGYKLFVHRVKPGHERANGRTVVVSDEMNVNMDEDGTSVGTRSTSTPPESRTSPG